MEAMAYVWAQDERRKVLVTDDPGPPVGYRFIGSYPLPQSGGWGEAQKMAEKVSMHDTRAPYEIIYEAPLTGPIDEEREMRYVVGFAFTPEKERVYLIRKARPEWQRGLLNGIGGKIENGETSEQAMVREFKEEAGLEVKTWEPVVRLLIEGNGAEIYFFRAFLNGERPSAQGDEPIFDYLISSIPCLRTIPNLRWLVPLALDSHVSGRNWIHITDITGR